MKIEVSLVHDADGNVDDGLSLQAYHAAVADYKVRREIDENMVRDAVNAQFDEAPGATQNVEALVGGAIARMKLHHTAYKAMKTKVSDFIHANSDVQADKRFPDRKAEAPRTRLFGIKKGFGGGICRWADVPVESK